MGKHFQGIMVSILTSFDTNGEITINELRKYLLFLLEHQVDSFLIPSGTEEFANLTSEQKRQLIKAAADTIKKRVPLVALISDCSTASVLELLKIAQGEGADEVILTPPYYPRIDQRTIPTFYQTIANKAKVPLWICQQPGETKLSLGPETVMALSKHPNICGIKVVCGDDFFYFTNLVHIMRGDPEFSVLNGEDYCTLPSYCVGGDGSVSSIANVIPGELAGIWSVHNQRDYEKAVTLQDRIMECCTFLKMVDTDAYQSACKMALREMGLYSTNRISRPLVEVLPQEEMNIIKRIKEMSQS